MCVGSLQMQRKCLSGIFLFYVEIHAMMFFVPYRGLVMTLLSFKNYFHYSITWNSYLLIKKLFLQLRLDFNQFVITGPSTSSMSVGKGAFGMVTGSALGKTLTLGSQCLTDTFSVTSPGGGAPPSICGINTGEHSNKYTVNSLMCLLFHDFNNHSVCGFFWIM